MSDKIVGLSRTCLPLELATNIPLTSTRTDCLPLAEASSNCYIRRKYKFEAMTPSRNTRPLPHSVMFATPDERSTSSPLIVSEPACTVTTMVTANKLAAMKILFTVD